MVEILKELRYTDYIVVDTERKDSFLKADLAVQITSNLGRTTTGWKTFSPIIRRRSSNREGGSEIVR